MPAPRPGFTPVAVLTAAAALTLPMLVYAAAAYRGFGFIRLSAYAPVEELNAALDSLAPARIWSAPLLSINMTSGELVSAMYTLTLGMVLLAGLLGIATAFWSVRRARTACRTGGGIAAGTGVIASVVAAQTSLLGCCGGGLAGGLLSLAGLGSATAAQASSLGQPAQAAVTAVLLVLAFRLKPSVPPA